MKKDGFDTDFSRIMEKTRRLDLRRITDMPGPEFKLLAVAGDLAEDLAEGEKLHVSDLVRETGAPAPLVSRSLKALEEKGLILRETDRSDRRSTIVTLTAAGQEKLAAACSRSCRLMDTVRERFGEEKMARLKELLEEMVDVTAGALEEIAGEEEGR